MFRTEKEQEADELLERAQATLDECIKCMGHLVVLHGDVYNTATKLRHRKALERLLLVQDEIQ